MGFLTFYIISAVVSLFFIFMIDYIDDKTMMYSFKNINSARKKRDIDEFNSYLKNIGLVFCFSFIPFFNTMVAILLSVTCSIGVLWYLILRISGFSHQESFDKVSW